MAIYFEDQTKEWKGEFFENYQLQVLYGDEIPVNLWKDLFSKARLGLPFDLFIDKIKKL